MKLILLFLTVVISTSAFAVEDKSRFWFGTFSKSELSQRFSFWHESQLRYATDVGATAQFLYRTGLLQKRSDDISFGYLYAFITTSARNEHRLTFQHSQKYNPWASHRARLEYRTFEGIDDTTSRFRYLFRAYKDRRSKLGLVVWDEVFVNLVEDDLSGNTHFDRNRFFIGFSKKHHNARMEFGYLNQFVPREDKDISEHTLVLYIFI